jgi:hypothetical protein
MRDYNKSFEQDFTDHAVKWLSDITNRSVNQTKFLYEVVGDWGMLLECEEAIKAFHIHYCPGDRAEAFYLIAKLRTWKKLGWLKDSKYTLVGKPYGND